MIQTIDEKIEVIKTLLPLIYAHRYFVVCAERPPRQEWVSERSALDPPPPLPPDWNLECDGHCHTCRAVDSSVKCPPEEKWLRVYHAVRDRYRIPDLEEALLKLSRRDICEAQAVWAVFVEPWPGEPYDRKRPEFGVKTEAISPQVRLERAVLARRGVRWLATNIEGDIQGESDHLPTKEEQAAALMGDGVMSPTVIAERLGVSYRHAKRLKRTVMFRQQSTASAVG